MSKEFTFIDSDTGKIHKSNHYTFGPGGTIKIEYDRANEDYVRLR